MNLSETITFFFIGLAVLLTVGIVWVLLRRRKRWAIVLTCLLVVGYVGYCAYYPYLQVSVHAEKYGKVSEYLETNYPDREFTIIPEHYEVGYTVGVFDINDKETPDLGVTLHVDDNDEIEQISNWTDGGFPAQPELWQELEFSYGETYTLDRDDIEITKQDEWIEGELTVFALTIDQMPAIAIYEYSQAGYGLMNLRVAEDGLVISAEAEGQVFIYIDERYKGEMANVLLENGETVSVDAAAAYKGKLVLME